MPFRTLFAIFLIMIAINPLYAQESQPSVLPSNPENHIVWEAGKPHADEIFLNGQRCRIIRHNGITIALRLVQHPEYFAANVVAINDGEKRILLDPSQSQIFAWKSFSEAEKGKPATAFQPVDADKLAKGIERRLAWATALNTFSATMATTQQTSTSNTNGNVSVYGSGGTANGTYRETTTTSTTGPDYEARRRAAEQNATIADQMLRNSADIREFALRANTIFPQGKATGYIYFHRKTHKTGTFSIQIDGKTYTFALWSLK